MITLYIDSITKTLSKSKLIQISSNQVVLLIDPSDYSDYICSYLLSCSYSYHPILFGSDNQHLVISNEMLDKSSTLEEESSIKDIELYLKRPLYDWVLSDKFIEELNSSNYMMYIWIGDDFPSPMIGVPLSLYRWTFDPFFYIFRTREFLHWRIKNKIQETQQSSFGRRFLFRSSYEWYTLWTPCLDRVLSCCFLILNEDNSVSLWNLSTHSEERGKGYASKLLELIDQWCDSDCIVIEVSSEREDLIQFYSRRGFQIESINVNHVMKKYKKRRLIKK